MVLRYNHIIVHKLKLTINYQQNPTYKKKTNNYILSKVYIYQKKKHWLWMAFNQTHIIPIDKGYNHGITSAPLRLHFGLLTFHPNQGLGVEVLHDAGRQQLWSQAGPEVLGTADGKGKKNGESSTDHVRIW